MCGFGENFSDQPQCSSCGRTWKVAKAGSAAALRPPKRHLIDLTCSGSAEGDDELERALALSMQETSSRSDVGQQRANNSALRTREPKIKSADSVLAQLLQQQFDAEYATSGRGGGGDGGGGGGGGGGVGAFGGGGGGSSIRGDSFIRGHNTLKADPGLPQSTQVASRPLPSSSMLAPSSSVASTSSGMSEAEKRIVDIVRLCGSLNQKFVDDSFVPGPSILRGLPPDTQAQVTQWLRPCNLRRRDGSRNPVLFDTKEPPRPSDLEQGSLGNCWLVSALAVLAQKPALLKAMFECKAYSMASKVGPLPPAQVRAISDKEQLAALLAAKIGV